MIFYQNPANPALGQYCPACFVPCTPQLHGADLGDLSWVVSNVGSCSACLTSDRAESQRIHALEPGAVFRYREWSLDRYVVVRKSLCATAVIRHTDTGETSTIHTGTIVYPVPVITGSEQEVAA